MTGQIRTRAFANRVHASARIFFNTGNGLSQRAEVCCDIRQTYVGAGHSRAGPWGDANDVFREGALQERRVNLKTAARRLGVHYQTAYRWVRSGQLLAVKVGAGYEISDAAVDRFEAQRAALERLPAGADDVPAAALTPAGSHAVVLHTLDRMIERVTLDARPVAQRAARMTADSLGDAAIVYRRAGVDGLEVLHVAHREPESEVLAATLVCDPRTSNKLARSVIATCESVFVPQVPQRAVRRRLHPELQEILLTSGCYSAVCVPIGNDGALLITRDAPGSPYTREDLEFAEAVAARIDKATTRARACAAALNLRRSVGDATLTYAEAHQDAVALSEAELEDLLESVIGDNTDAIVALLDLGLRHLACSKPYALLLADEKSAVVGLALPDLVTDETALADGLCAVLRGELDYRSIEVALREGRGRASLHVVMVRRRDATPWGIIITGNADPDLPEA
jgi:excisionase family DNA binding protein